jgi:NAD(P)-dependent dehydrogenase (short-subunit alcohol dehydrogenase family)
VVYGMTKAAVITMTKGLAKELGPAGIRVNAIAPGLVETKFAGALIEDPEIQKRIKDSTPLGRHGQPEEIVGAALYLASDISSFTTGSVVVCDGGATA